MLALCNGRRFSKNILVMSKDDKTVDSTIEEIVDIFEAHW